MLIYFTHVNDFQVVEKFTYTTVIIFLKTCKQSANPTYTEIYKASLPVTCAVLKPEAKSA